MTIDTQENKTDNFCKRYRASIMQTRDMIDIQSSSSPWKDLALSAEIMQQRIPAVDVRLSNNSLDLLVKDYNELTELQQYFKQNPEALNEYLKFKTWKAISE